MPGRVTKLDKFLVKRVRVVDGKFMAFFAEQQGEFPDEAALDSEVDSEEMKDVVLDAAFDRQADAAKASGAPQSSKSSGAMLPLHKVSSASSARESRSALQGGDDSSKRRGGTPEGFGTAVEFKK